MAKLSVTNYKTSPERRSFVQMEPKIKKYGLSAASELEEWDIGPYCADISCRIPYGVTVGDGIAVSVYVTFSKGYIEAISVCFNSMYWDQIVPILQSKYGNAWKYETDTNMLVTDLASKTDLVLERKTLRHSTSGLNPKTKVTCEISATNVDTILAHHDPLRIYHGTVQLLRTNRDAIKDF